MELKNLIATSATVDVYKEGNMAIKVFKEGCPKTMALYEALTHSRVEATGLRVPVIHEVSVIGNRWAIHMDCIEGKTLAQVMKDDPANKDKYISDMVDIQIEIHSKQAPKLSKLKDKMTRQINSLDCIDDATKYELLTRLDSRPKHTKLCHGNFTPENIILNENGTYIVTGWRPVRATPVPMWAAPICCCPCTIRIWRKNISTCSVSAPTPRKNMCRSGSPSWRLPS